MSSLGARERILATAADLFYEHGFHAVGVDLIIERAGVAKTTLYRHFGSKDDLIVAYLDDANTRFWSWFEDAVNPNMSPREQLVGLFDAVAKLATSAACLGCTFQVTAAEFPDAGHPGHATALDHKQSVRTRLRDLASAAGAPEPTDLADGLLLLMDGAFAAARMYGRSSPAAGVATAARTLIDAHLLPGRRTPQRDTAQRVMFESLDFIYVPTGDVDTAAAHHQRVLGAELLWKVRAMETTVAALRLSTAGPQILLSGHLEGERPILVYRVADYQAAVAALRAGGLSEIEELEIPHGPCAGFRLEGGQRYALYQLTRPQADEHFAGRIDE